MLGQVLGGGLLCQAGAVQELPLQQGQVSLWGAGRGLDWLLTEVRAPGAWR